MRPITAKNAGGRSSRDTVSLLIAAAAAGLACLGFAGIFLHSSAPPPAPAPVQPAKDLSDETTYAPLDTSFPTLAFPSPANLNGGFERESGEMIPEWHPDAAETLPGWTPAAAAARTGKNGMRLSLTPGAGENARARLVSAPMDAGPGDVVKFNVWIRPEGDPGCQPVALVEALAGGEWRRVAPEARVAELLVPGGADWAPRGRSCIVPAGTERIRLVLECAARGPEGAGWHADDFLCEIVSLRRYAAEHAAAPRLPDVVLLGADTLRNSPLGCYGHPTNATPHVDRLAAEGVRYDQVTTASPWTRPSFGSIFTSLYPSQHTAELHLSALPQSVTTLAEVLHDRGYFTVGFVRTLFDGFVGPGTGFDQGFDIYLFSEDTEEVSAMTRDFLDLNADALRALGGGGVVLFRHLYEPHSEYINHTPDVIRNEGGMLGTVNLTFQILDDKLFKNDPALTNEHDVDYARRVYDGEAAFMDMRVGEMLDRLRAFGLYDAAHIVFFSDHGESFNEKPGAWCHSTPYETCTRVPLILRLPGKTPAGAVVSDLASPMDILPTLLAALDIPGPAGMEGRNLLDTAAPPPAHSISEDRKMGYLTVRDGHMKLAVQKASTARRNEWEAIRDWALFAPDSPATYELYDLEADPWELNDLSGARPADLHRLKTVLFAHCVRYGIAPREDALRAAPAHLPPEGVEALKRVLDAQAAAPDAAAHTGEEVQLSPEMMEDIISQGYMNVN